MKRARDECGAGIAEALDLVNLVKKAEMDAFSCPNDVLLAGPNTRCLFSA